MCTITLMEPHHLTPWNKLALILYNRARQFGSADSLGLPTLDAFYWVREDFRRTLGLSENEILDLTRRVSLIHSFFYPDEIARIYRAKKAQLT